MIWVQSRDENHNRSPATDATPVDHPIACTEMGPSAGLRTHGRGRQALLLIRRFPRREPQCCVAGSFPITAAGQCRSGASASPASLFIRRLAIPGTDEAKIMGVLGKVNTKCCVEQ